MKKIMMLALALMVTTIALTQKPKHQPNPELQNEMQSHIEKNVIPVLQKAQDDFDAKLNAEDLKFIQTKRLEMTKIRAEEREMRKAKREKRKAERPKNKEERKAKKEQFENMTDAEKEVFRKERKAEHKADRDKMKAKYGDSKKEIKAFMERNKELISTTIASLKPNYETWIAEQKAILKKYKQEGTPEINNRNHGKKIGLFGLDIRGKHHGFHKGRKRGKGKMKGEKRGKRKGKKIAVAFVLWNGTTPTPPIEKRTSNIGSTIPNNNAKALLGQNFPNPAKGVTQIEIEIPEGVSQMTLTVTGMNGKVAQRLNLTDLSTGKETVEVNVNDLPSGQYFYTIEYNGLKETKKMTVNK